METIQMDLQVIVEDRDAETIHQITGRLKKELRNSELVEDIQFARGPAPEGAKSSEEILVGFIVVSLLPTMLGKFMDFLNAYTLRNQDQSIEVSFHSRAGEGFTVKAPISAKSEDVNRFIEMVERKSIEMAERKPKVVKKNG